MNYYDRGTARHVDGTGIFQTDADRQTERVVAAELEAVWNCKVRSFGALAPVDCYAERHGRLASLLEIKGRSHAYGTYPTVYLNVRKWLALKLGSLGLGCPAVFVVKFQDGIYWIDIRDVDASRHMIAGCTHRVKSDNDIEPVIEVPVSALRPLRKTDLQPDSERSTDQEPATPPAPT